MTILDDIIKYKRVDELPKLKQRREPAQVQAEAKLSPAPLDFVASLRAAPGVALIAEVKKASSTGGLTGCLVCSMKASTSCSSRCFLRYVR